MSDSNDFILKISCPGITGLVASIGGFLAERGCFIKEFRQFDDLHTGRFFATVRFFSEGQVQPTVEQLSAAFEVTGQRFSMDWSFHSANDKARVLIMVSKFDHCLRDLLYRRASGELPIEITGIVSNHPDLKYMADQEGIDYYHLPITPETKVEQEAKLFELIDSTQSDLVVLARYMQVLTDEASAALAGRCINIHHSFLPGFKGARPYHQAYERGVKLIGATAHYVTGDLDEGPIIEQRVERVGHADDAEQMAMVGRDTEAQTLARAVKYHTQHRVHLNGGRTVVL